MNRAEEAVQTSLLNLSEVFLKFNECFKEFLSDIHDVSVCASPVEGGQRAIVFNRVGGMQMDTVLAEGLHFR